MARKKPTAEDYEERMERAEQLKKYMKDNLFTEVKFAEVSGISRRTVQMLKSARITPTPRTLTLLNGFFAKHQNIV